MIEWRCGAPTKHGACRRVLMRLALAIVQGEIELEIICPKCGAVRRRTIRSRAVA